MRIKKVTVTAHDIKYGVPRNASFCPVAKAIRRAFSYKVEVDVRIKHCWLNDSLKGIKLPEAATEFIITFDAQQERPVKPFTFILKYQRLEP